MAVAWNKIAFVLHLLVESSGTPPPMLDLVRKPAFSKQGLLDVTAFPRGMGSLPRGTLCAHCGVEEAGYVPDGSVGPTCDTCMFERSLEQINSLRLRRLWRMKVALLAGPRMDLPHCSRFLH